MKGLIAERERRRMIKMKEESHQRCEMKGREMEKRGVWMSQISIKRDMKASSWKLVGAVAQILLGYSKENIARS